MKTFKVFDNLINDELEIIMGKSADENWKIIDDSSENDIWFHLDNFPSSHVILKTKGKDFKELNKQTLIHCASLCKENSKYSNMKNISVIYTKIKNVKKADTVGSVTTTSTKSVKI
jgi:predicted ribosome quality control (RQC) complex YloA/Tae2 family protein